MDIQGRGRTHRRRRGVFRQVIIGTVAVVALGGLSALALHPARTRAAAPDRADSRAGAVAAGASVEVVAAADLLAMPPGVLRSVKARVQNRIGSVQPGAEFTVVDVSESFYKIAVECQDGKVRVQAWLDRAATRPAAAR